MGRRPNDPWEFSLLRPLAANAPNPALPGADAGMEGPGPLLRPSAAPPAEQQVALNAFEKVFVSKEVEKNARSVLEAVTDGAFTPQEINTLYGQILNTIKSGDALSFAGINPNDNPIVVTPAQLGIINSQIDSMKGPALDEIRERARKALQKSLDSGRIIAQ